MKTRKIVTFGLMLAVSVLLNYLESLIPLPFMFPGAKLGLANAMGIVVLFMFGASYYVGFGFLRILLSALLWSGFGSAFFISMGGMILASAITLVLYFISKFSIFGISVGGAIMHGVGQIIAVCILYNTTYLFLYVIVLTISGAITGTLVALVAKQIIIRLPNKKALN